MALISSLTRTWMPLACRRQRSLQQTHQNNPTYLFYVTAPLTTTLQNSTATTMVTQPAPSKCHCYKTTALNIPSGRHAVAYRPSLALPNNNTSCVTTSAHPLSTTLSSSSLRSSTTSSSVWYNRAFRLTNSNNRTFDTCYRQTRQNCHCNYPLTSLRLHLQTVQLLSGCQQVQTQSQHFSIKLQDLKKHGYAGETVVMDAPKGVFRGSVDRFNGIKVESEQEIAETEDFATKLQTSLAYWMCNKRRAIWFAVRNEHAAWVPHLAEAGFKFHHVHDSALVMFRWLPRDEYVNIPTFAHTMLGVGGLVVNDKNELLVVSDRYALIENSWKLPGGYVEPREEIVDAAIREVKEETGIDCEFRTLIAIRHSHNGNFGCSDMYIVIALKPLNFELKKCDREIAKLQWMPVQEYLKHPDVHETNRSFLQMYFDFKARNIRFTYKRAQHRVLHRYYTLFYMEPIEDGRKCDQK